jgi:type III secretion protein L
VLEKLSGEMHWLATVAINPDPSLAKGVCILQTGSGTLEIGVQAQLDAFSKAAGNGGINKLTGHA